MRWAAMLCAMVFAATSVAGSANADAIISGPGCAVDGNTVQVGSKLVDHKCWGGINVRLHGSVARNLGELCTDSKGETWPCGQAARYTLTELLKSRSITCYHIDGEFRDSLPVVTCLSGRRDLALEMVQRGMAAAAHDESKRYELEEADAKSEKRGIWR